MPRYAAAADVLLGDVFALVVSFLTGVDLLRLSHVNQRLYHELLAPNASEWRSRAPRPSANSTTTAKARYFQFTSVRFLGREMSETTVRDRGGAVEVWSRGLPVYWRSNSFSLELMFALLPSDAHTTVPTYLGGILLGAQSVPWSTKRWADSHQQFVHVDAQRNLYCSVVDQKPTVAKNLEVQRWYHVALTFERRADLVLPTQRVFLDGALVHEMTGSLHSEWWNLRFGQVGSGSISGGSPGKPSDAFVGWYGFHGVIDDCRLWNGMLGTDQIRSYEAQPAIYSDNLSLQWSLRDSGYDPLGLAVRVQCTRPEERVCIDVFDIDDIAS